MSNTVRKNEYITGLDGLRSFAVLAVVFYHLSFSWAKGGFLGVDVFFVISGYLITSKILSSKEDDHTFNYKRFWLGRMRRLLPAAYTMIIAVVIWTLFFNRKILSNLTGDAISSIFSVTNWWFIFHKLSYFDSFASPSPLKNLWSLAVETQFYVIWPIVLMAGLKIFKKRDKLARAVFIGALCSAALMAILYVPGMDPSRIYYGTDTRCFEMLIGSCLAIIYPMNRFSSDKLTTKKLSNNQKIFLNVLGTISFIIFILGVFFVNEYKEFLYRGGMFLVSLNAALLIICICNPHSYLNRLFSFKPLSWIGKRSYGIYLWHYPIIILSTPVYEIGNPSYLRVIVQITFTFIIAHLSYHLIEEPVRKYGFKKFFRNCLSIEVINPKNLFLNKNISTAVIALIFLTATSCTTSVLKSKQQPELLVAAPVEVSSSDSGAKETIANETASEAGTDKKPEISTDTEKDNLKPKDTQAAPDETSKTATLPEKKSYSQILAIGDSVMLDIAAKLKEQLPNITVDGKVGRQMYQAVDLVPSYSKFNHPDNAVIIELGSNGYFTDKQIDKVLSTFSNAHIYLVNVRVPRQWESEVNKALDKKSKEYGNITLIDWYSEAIKHKEYFTADGVHLQPKGAEALASLIYNAIGNKN